MTAALSVIILIGAIGWKVDQSFQKSQAGISTTSAPAGSDSGNESAASSGAGLGIGSTSAAADPYAPSVISDNVAATLATDYAATAQGGAYSTSSAVQAAQALGASLNADVTYRVYGASDIKTDPDTSYAGMLAYRASLQKTFTPLLANKQPELDMFSRYVETQDPQYLTELQQAADNYKLAAAETAQVVVPADAVSVQIGILNAMQSFAATLDQMAASADDPVAEAALVNTYLQGQQQMFSTFNALYAYYKSKQQ